MWNGSACQVGAVMDAMVNKDAPGTFSRLEVLVAATENPVGTRTPLSDDFGSDQAVDLSPEDDPQLDGRSSCWCHRFQGPPGAFTW